jgi:hypothetical protein
MGKVASRLRHTRAPWAATGELAHRSLGKEVTSRLPHELQNSKPPVLNIMPYDPNLPQAGTEIDAVQMRAQLNGLKSIIDAVPTITSAVVDAVTTLPAGDPATVAASVMADVLHLTFGIPQGQSGLPGEVTLADMNAAIATTSSNSNAVVNLNELAEGTYNQTQMQNLINKVDELINALRR